MTDEPEASAPGEIEDAPRRVRRRRSSSRSRRSRRVQTRIPFTSLRFSRPRLPTPAQTLNLALGVVALGLGVWTIDVASQTNTSLDQLRSQLAMNTRGAAAGRQAADQLAAQAQADTAQMMAAQDAARRAASVAPSFAPSGGYYPRPLDQGASGQGGSPYSQTGYGQTSYGQTSYGQTGYAPPAYGASPYGASPYGASPYSPPAASPPASGVMGYTLPSSSHPPTNP